MAMILSAKLMLDWLEETEKAAVLEDAVAQVIKDGKIRTYDMGGADSSIDMARAVAERIC
jgi:isocitrate/isopropylmalate dehydrogenase